MFVLPSLCLFLPIYFLKPCYSKCALQNSITQELVGNAESQALPQNLFFNKILQYLVGTLQFEKHVSKG